MADSATWQRSPSRTLASQPTVLSGPQLLAPRITPSPTCCEPNEVAIEISTTVLVPDYIRFYDTPISEFHPSYSTLPDGSLIAAPFLDDLARSYLSLLVTAMLATLFLRNIIVCFDYLRRAKMKRRVLFYLLLCSQLLSVRCSFSFRNSFFFKLFQYLDGSDPTACLLLQHKCGLHSVCIRILALDRGSVFPGSCP
jgi:hypothetical protein